MAMKLRRKTYLVESNWQLYINGKLSVGDAKRITKALEYAYQQGIERGERNATQQQSMNQYKASVVVEQVTA